MGQHTFYGGPSALETSSKPTRRRRWHYKTRTGCDTCKQRRVKCTEEQPECRKCKVGGRTCIYSERPDAKISELGFHQAAQLRPATAMTATREPCEEQRAFQFFHEKTAPMMATFTSFTKHFWTLIVPQVAASQPSVRHLAIALASRQEKELVTSTSEVTRLQILETKHYASSLSSLTKGPTLGDMEVLLLASALFLGYGNFDDLERQSAQHLIHLGSGLRILHERADSLRPTGDSEIIDQLVQPMFARLELMYSVFMAPYYPASYSVPVEPAQPVLPLKIGSILQARRLYVRICCYRYHRTFREQPWSCVAPGFLVIRQMLLDWYHLVLAYQGETNAQSEAEQQRIAVMLSQFRLLFVAFIYSGRTDLHSGEGHLRPSQVELVEKEQVSILFDLPARYLRLLPGLDWESEPLKDPLQVRLWPEADIISTSEYSVAMSVTFQI